MSNISASTFAYDALKRFSRFRIRTACLDGIMERSVAAGVGGDAAVKAKDYQAQGSW